MLNFKGMRKAHYDIIEPCAKLVEMIMQGDNSNLSVGEYKAYRDNALTFIYQELERQFLLQSMSIDFTDE